MGDEDYTKIERPTLAQILSPELAIKYWLFWLTMTFVITLIYSTFYLFRTVYLLACIEDMKTKRNDDSHDSEVTDRRSLDQSWLISLTPSQQPNFPLNTFSLHSSHDASLFSRLLSNLRSLLNNMLKYGKALLHYSEKERNMICRDLYTCTRQLRYFSGRGTFFLRAIIPYLLYYHILPWSLRFAITIVPYMVVFIRTTNDDDRSWTNPWEYWVLGATKIVTPVLMQRLWKFHTFRVLSISTGFTTNFANEYIFDNDADMQGNPDPRYKYSRLQVWLKETFQLRSFVIHFTYGFLDAATALLPFFLAKPLAISDNFYSMAKDKRNSNFLLLDPDRRLNIFAVFSIWFLLQALRMAWSGLMYRCHVSNIGSRHQTIVYYQRNKSGVRPSFEKTGCLRLGRILFQITVAGGIVTIIAVGIMSLYIFALSNGDLLTDWLARAYLEFDTSVSCLGSLWSATFWIWQLVQMPFNPSRGDFDSWKSRQQWADPRNRPDIMPFDDR